MSEDEPHGVDRPVIILGPPRSGTTLLFSSLAMHPDLWHLPGESNHLLEGPFHPSNLDRSSNRLTEQDLDEQTRAWLIEEFHRRCLNLRRVPVDAEVVLGVNTVLGRAVRKAAMPLLRAISARGKPERVRLLEKSPRNTMRIPFLEALFPDALYLLNFRGPTRTLDSLVAGWHAEDRLGPIRRDRYAFPGYPDPRELGIRGYDGDRWKFELVPGWEDLEDASLGEVCALQYYQCCRYLLDDIEAVETERVHRLRHEDLVQRPQATLAPVLEWAGLEKDASVLSFPSKAPRLNSPDRDVPRSQLRYPEEVERGLAFLKEKPDIVPEMGYEPISRS